MTCRPSSRFARLVALLALWLAAAPAGAGAQVFYPDDPVRVDPDRRHVEAKPASRGLSDYYDYVENAVLDAGEDPGRATNVNTLGEVPVSSWYAGARHYHPTGTEDRLSVATLRDGPLGYARLDTTRAWSVVRATRHARTPRLTVTDAAGHRFVLKFDAPGHPELSTGAEIVASRLLWALGYRVPENALVRFTRRRLALAADARFVQGDGSERPLTVADLDAFLSDAARYPDGTYRALASRFLPGQPLGPFAYHGTRPDDPNDIFPHERRRELRGLRLAAAWLHFEDARSVNTMDTFVREGARHYVRHHLAGFETALGAGPAGPKAPWVGHESLNAWRAVALSALTLGLAGRPWTRHDDTPNLEAVGRLDTTSFDPTRWRPPYRNPAFDAMDADDAFWMARQIAHFTDAELRAVAEAARYTTPAATRYVARALAARRDAIAAAYLGHGGGFDRARLGTTDGDVLALRFDDLPRAFARRTGQAVAGIAPNAAPRYRVRWHRFDNGTGQRGARLEAVTRAAPVASLPPEARTSGFDGRFLVAVLSRAVPPSAVLPSAEDAPSIEALAERPAFAGTTEVYLCREGAAAAAGRWRVVGLRRHAEGLPRTRPAWMVLPERWRPATSGRTASGNDGDGSG